MKKLQVKLPHIATKFLWIGLAVGVVLVLVAYGAVRQEQADRVEAANAAHERQVQLDAQKSLQAEVAQAQTATQAEKAKTDAVCTAFKAVAAKNKTIAVPQLCVSNI